MVSRLRLSLLLLLFPLLSLAQGQKDTIIHKRNMPPLVITSGAKTDPLLDYRPSATKINDLIDTRLALQFNFDSCFLYGEAWITLKPHFYPTDSLTLDAKGMAFQVVALHRKKQQRPLKYMYDGRQLHLRLDRTYTRNEQYTIYLKYTAKPNDYAASSEGGSASVTSDKGLFFIDPHQSDPYKPTEVWSMGYPESNSVWFPTIDKPNQKSTGQITLTVADSFTTFSNGRLVQQKENPDGTRSDTWKMVHPNAPYLFTLAVGPFEVITDHWKNIPVRYYVEKPYAPHANAIFGHTPEMIDYFSKILRTPYPWESYDQVVVRDFITGAMENTSASMFGESLYKTQRQLQDDGYRNESVIAHELFHQWFGDLVTCESWSNITLNESFGNYGEMLWAEHKYGADLAAQHNYQAMQTYFNFADTHKDHPLVYRYYPDKKEVLDPVAYQKGGRILHMLRYYVGDSAFFDALHDYLEQNKYQSAEATQLRLAFEKVTGKDLRLFWQQWYHRKGYPKLDISYKYNDSLKTARVLISQVQEGPVFMLPFAIDVYEGGKKHRYQVTMKKRNYVFSYKYKQRPDLINVDGDKVLLVKKKDHKSLSSYIYQYHKAGNYLDRREAIVACAAMQDSSELARGLLLTAMNDQFYGLRRLAIDSLNIKNRQTQEAAFPILKRLLRGDPHSSVRSAALVALTTEEPAKHRAMILHALKDSSLQVKSTALSILNDFAPQKAYKRAKSLQAVAEAPLTQTICTIYAQQGHLEDFAYVKKQVHQTGSFGKFDYLNAYFKMLGNTVTSDAVVTSELQSMKDFVKVIGPRYGYYILGLLNNLIKDKQQAADKATNNALRKRLAGQARYSQKLMKEIAGMLE